MTDSQSSALTRRMQLVAPRPLYFLVFAISGFSGLIYESIWTHYLKLFLGHAAYAQSLVLIIFMGGMALGSWVASRLSSRSSMPILIYAGVELVIGLVALVFHDLFANVIDLFYTSVLPSIGSPTLGASLKWIAASLLIMPQSIMLGMTFPLMSAGIIRRFPDAPGSSIAMLYFTNSIGAAIGVLVSGFWLIKMVGLPGTILSAGLINVALAIVVWMMIRLDPNSATQPIAVQPTQDASSSVRTLFMIAAFVTGAASFIYEISWIRMLSLVLGATTHSFELMLSAFITGLAFGGLWLKRRIDRITEPVRFSGYVQLIMGALALATIPVYMSSFDWMSWLMMALNKNEAGFAGYSVASHIIALSVMLPTTFMAGMTLPLFTYVLIRQGDGEGSIGRIYAANTVGAIVGVLFAVHIGLPLLGVKNLVVFGAFLDIVLGVALLSRVVAGQQRMASVATAAAFGLVALVLTLGYADLDRKVLVSAVYRLGHLDIALEDDIVYYQDGKTATVSLRHSPPTGNMVLATNGKPDAGIQVDDPDVFGPDELTMMLIGALPFAYNPDATRIANIGMGSGQTTHTLLALESLETVDTIEIESAMVEASSLIGPVVARAHNDPRSHIYIEDAKTFFSLHNSRYDIIIAEPSNPWVSGVASLFSTEFYHTIGNYLNDDGVFVQWIQLYEFNNELAVSILKALAENFSDFIIYTSVTDDLLLIARNEGRLGQADWSALFDTELGTELAKVDVVSPDDVKIRKVVDRDTLVPLLGMLRTRANSDYFPYVDLNAGRARFTQSNARLFLNWMLAPLPVLEMLSRDSIDFDRLIASNFHARLKQVEAARNLQRAVTGSSIGGGIDQSVKLDGRMQNIAEWLLFSQYGCAADDALERWQANVFDLAAMTLPYVSPDAGLALLETIGAGECGVQNDPSSLLWLDLYAAVARRDGAEMSAAGRAVLASGQKVSNERLDYAIAATMLGDLAAGRRTDAEAAWIEFGAEALGDVELSGPLKLIMANAIAAPGEEPAISARNPD